MIENSHNIQINRQKTGVHYYKNSSDDFRVIIVSPSPTLTNSENEVIATYFGKIS